MNYDYDLTDKKDILFNNAMGIFPPSVKLAFKKISIGFFKSLFSKKSKWQAIGYIASIEPCDVIYKFVSKAKEKFPAAKVIYSFEYFDIYSDTKYEKSMGKIDLILEFADTADEAEFIAKSQNFMEEIVKELQV